MQHSFFCVTLVTKIRSTAGFEVFSGERKWGTETLMLQLKEISSEGAGEMFVNKQRQQSLGNITAQAKNCFVFKYVCVCLCVCLFASLSSRWVTPSKTCRPLQGRYNLLGPAETSVSSQTPGHGFDFRQNHCLFFFLLLLLWQNLPGILGIKKQFQVLVPVCWRDRGEKKREKKKRCTQSWQESCSLFCRRWRISDSHFKRPFRRNLFSRKRSRFLP